MTHSPVPDHRPGAWTGVNHCTTPAYRFEAELLQEGWQDEEWWIGCDRQIQSLMELSQDGVLLLDGNGSCVKASPTVCQLLHLPAQALVGQPLAHFIQSPETFLPYWNHLLQRGQWRDTLGFSQPDGSIRQLDVSARAHFFPQHHLFLVHPDRQGKTAPPLPEVQEAENNSLTSLNGTSGTNGHRVVGRSPQRQTEQAIAIQQSELHDQVHRLNAHLERLNTYLEEQVQERTRQLQQTLEFEGLIKRITDKMRDSLDEQQILQTVVQELALALDLECCDTGIYNADKTISTLVCEYTRSLIPALGKSLTVAESSHQAIYQTLFTGQVCQICDRLPNGVRADQLYLTILACPIFDNQEVLGDLWLFRRRGHVFTEKEVQLATQVATQCAIALRQARLYHMARSQVTELERLHQIKDDFLSAVTHELRSPMSNIKMSAEMLEIQLRNLGILPTSDASTPTSTSTQRYFTILKEECQREANLINDLLDLARVEAGREVITPMAIQLCLWVSHIVETFTERAQQRDLALQVQIPRDLMIETDLSCLERILSELLHNACKYTPAGETIAITARDVAQQLEISVRNSGVEIPAGEQERIFEKFYRIPGSDPLRQGGTGLGLSLVRELAHYLGGQIQVQSGDRRTRFILTLPPCSTSKI